MSNPYYNVSGWPATGASGTSSPARAELALIAAGFALLPTLAANGSKAVIVNAGATALSTTTGTLALAGNFSTVGAFAIALTATAGTALTLPTSGTLLSTAAVITPAQGGTGIANNNASTLTISGAFATTLTVTAGTGVTLPTTGTLSTLAGAEELTNKTLNASVGKGTWTASGTWTLPALTLGGAITYGGVTLTNAVTGTGSMALSASPTFTGTVTIATLALTTVGAHTISGAITYGGVTLSNAVTGTGNMVLSASPTLTGTLTAATINASGQITISKAAGTMLQVLDTTASKNGYFNYASGNWDIYTDGPAQQLRITGTAGATNYLTVTGSNGGNPTISASSKNVQFGTGILVTNSLNSAAANAIGLDFSSVDNRIISYGPSAGTNNVLTILTVDSAGNAVGGTGSEMARFSATGYFKASNVGTYYSSTGAYHEFRNNQGSGTTMFIASSSSTSKVSFFINSVDSENYSATACAGGFGRDTASGRSVNAGGTVNASGADYAEYMRKSSLDLSFQKGAVVRLDRDGLLTDKWNPRFTALVKSTDPSYVGGDSWGIGISDKSELEAARQWVDRVAMSGQVPVNVSVFDVGDLIRNDEGGPVAWDIFTDRRVPEWFHDYLRTVGRVIRRLPDGRAEVVVTVH